MIRRCAVAVVAGSALFVGSSAVAQAQEANDVNEMNENSNVEVNENSNNGDGRITVVDMGQFDDPMEDVLESMRGLVNLGDSSELPAPPEPAEAPDPVAPPEPAAAPEPPEPAEPAPAP
jgi:hypothetical protein